MLIIAGGRGKGAKVLATVEVMDTETHRWSTAADLPKPMYLASATVCGDQLYMLGGINQSLCYSNSVYTCSVSDLLQSCVSSQPHLAASGRTKKASVWRQAADLPAMCSTCESFCSQLLAVGGMMDSGKPITAVYMYNSTTNSWEIISHMTTGRYRCFTGVLPANRLMVVGGYTDYYGGNMTDTAELASV